MPMKLNSAFRIGCVFIPQSTPLDFMQLPRPSRPQIKLLSAFHVACPVLGKEESEEMEAAVCLKQFPQGYVLGISDKHEDLKLLFTPSREEADKWYQHYGVRPAGIRNPVWRTYLTPAPTELHSPQNFAPEITILKRWGVDLFDDEQIGRIGRDCWQCLLGAAQSRRDNPPRQSGQGPRKADVLRCRIIEEDKEPQFVIAEVLNMMRIALGNEHPPWSARGSRWRWHDVTHLPRVRTHLSGLWMPMRLPHAGAEKPQGIHGETFQNRPELLPRRPGRAEVCREHRWQAFHRQLVMIREPRRPGDLQSALILTDDDILRRVSDARCRGLRNAQRISPLH